MADATVTVNRSSPLMTTKFRHGITHVQNSLRFRGSNAASVDSASDFLNQIAEWQICHMSGASFSLMDICPSGTQINGDQNMMTTSFTLNVISTTSFKNTSALGGVLEIGDYPSNYWTVSYTGKTLTAFTGCIANRTGLVSAGKPVRVYQFSSGGSQGLIYDAGANRSMKETMQAITNATPLVTAFGIPSWLHDESKTTAAVTLPGTVNITAIGSQTPAVGTPFWVAGTTTFAATGQFAIGNYAINYTAKTHNATTTSASAQTPSAGGTLNVVDASAFQASGRCVAGSYNLSYTTKNTASTPNTLGGLAILSGSGAIAASTPVTQGFFSGLTILTGSGAVGTGTTTQARQSVSVSLANASIFRTGANTADLPLSDATSRVFNYTNRVGTDLVGCYGAAGAAVPVGTSCYYVSGLNQPSDRTAPTTTKIPDWVALIIRVLRESGPDPAPSFFRGINTYQERKGYTGYGTGVLQSSTPASHYLDNADWHQVKMHLALYAGVKAYDSSILVGGPHLAMGGTRNVTSRDYPLGGARTPFDVGVLGAGNDAPYPTDNDFFVYWVNNVSSTTIDFLSLDYSTIDFSAVGTAEGVPSAAGGTYPSTDTATLEKIMNWIPRYRATTSTARAALDAKGMTGVPVWWIEDYFDVNLSLDGQLPDSPTAGNGAYRPDLYSDAFQATAKLSIWVNEILGGAEASFHWQPEGADPTADNPDRITGNMYSMVAKTGGNPATIVDRTYHYGDVYPTQAYAKFIKDHFPAGTQLLATSTTDNLIEIIAKDAKALILNKYGSAKVVTLATAGGATPVDVTMPAFSAQVVDVPGDPPSAIAPTASMSAASNIVDTSAQLNGTVNPGGAATTYYFQWDTKARIDTGGTYRNDLPVSHDADAGSGTADVTVLVGIATGTLTAETDYTARLRASNGIGSVISSPINFTTTAAPPAPTPPSVSINPPTSVHSTTARLNGVVNPNGTATTYQFDWDTKAQIDGGGGYRNHAPSTAAAIGAGTTDVAVFEDITGLVDGVVYSVVLNASGDGSAASGTLTFTASEPTVTRPVHPYFARRGRTPDRYLPARQLSVITVTPNVSDPIATTTAATGVGETSASLTGTVDPGGDPFATWWMEWGDNSASPGAYDHILALTTVTSATGVQSVSAGISGLTASTQYWFRVRISNSVSTSDGAELSFTTSAPTSVPAREANYGPRAEASLPSRGTPATSPGTITLVAADTTSLVNKEYNGDLTVVASGTRQNLTISNCRVNGKLVLQNVTMVQGSTVSGKLGSDLEVIPPIAATGYALDLNNVLGSLGYSRAANCPQHGIRLRGGTKATALHHLLTQPLSGSTGNVGLYISSAGDSTLGAAEMSIQAFKSVDFQDAQVHFDGAAVTDVAKVVLNRFDEGSGAFTQCYLKGGTDSVRFSRCQDSGARYVTLQGNGVRPKLVTSDASFDPTKVLADAPVWHDIYAENLKTLAFPATTNLTGTTKYPSGTTQQMANVINLSQYDTSGTLQMDGRKPMGPSPLGLAGEQLHDKDQIGTVGQSLLIRDKHYDFDSMFCKLIIDPSPAWASGTNYGNGATVLNGGVEWRAKTLMAPSTVAPSEGANWTTLAWQNSITYVRGDQVRSASKLWRALRTNVGVTPVQGNDWSQFGPMKPSGAILRSCGATSQIVPGNMGGPANDCTIRLAGNLTFIRCYFKDVMFQGNDDNGQFNFIDCTWEAGKIDFDGIDSELGGGYHRCAMPDPPNMMNDNQMTSGGAGVYVERCFVLGHHADVMVVKNLTKPQLMRSCTFFSGRTPRVNGSCGCDGTGSSATYPPSDIKAVVAPAVHQDQADVGQGLLPFVIDDCFFSSGGHTCFWLNPNQVGGPYRGWLVKNTQFANVQAANQELYCRGAAPTWDANGPLKAGGPGSFALRGNTFSTNFQSVVGTGATSVTLPITTAITLQVVNVKSDPRTNANNQGFLDGPGSFSSGSGNNKKDYSYTSIDRVNNRIVGVTTAPSTTGTLAANSSLTTSNEPPDWFQGDFFDCLIDPRASTNAHSWQHPPNMMPDKGFVTVTRCFFTGQPHTDNLGTTFWPGDPATPYPLGGA